MLDKNESSFRAIFMYAGIGMVITSPDGKVTEANPAFQVITGRSLQDLEGLQIEELFLPEISDKEALCLDILKEGKTDHCHSYRQLLHKNGAAVPCSVVMSVVPSENQPTTIYMIQDISDSIEAIEIYKRYHFLFEHARDIIMFVDTNGQILEANRAAEQAYGFYRQELLNMHISDLRAEDTRIQIPLQMHVANIEGITFETYHRRKDGSTFPVEVSSRGEKLGGNKVLLSIIRDITERKRYEQDLTRRNVELTEALEKLKHVQVQLLQQDKLAAIGQLAAGIAHEINNPLSYISANFHTLEKYVAVMESALATVRTPDEQLNDILADLPALFSECHEGIARVSEIVKGLKLFSRIDSLNGIEAYDLNTGIKTTLLVAKNELKYVAKVNEELSPLPLIHANGGQINQVLLNLILNSAQAIAQAERGDAGAITVRTHSDAELVYVEIEDNGTGIAQQDAQRVFDPFYTTKPPGQGTGLGLSISYDIIVNKHKGDISFTSMLGEGTVFQIKIPITAAKNTN